MKSDYKFFNGSKLLPIDNFFHNVLYDKKNGYYSSRQPFGSKGDFITAPKISNLFSEIITVWIVSAWEAFKKPKKFNIVELGPGDGSFIKNFLKVSKCFPEFDKAKNIYLFEKSKLLRDIQKNNIKNNEVKWVDNFQKIKNGPVICFGNEFFDAIPIKQFKRQKKKLLEKYFQIQKDFTIRERFRNARKIDVKSINSYKTLKNLKFIEFPKKGFYQLKKMIRKILNSNGCILLIDYGYLRPNNQDTLQSVLKHKKNYILSNLGKADVTSQVNFKLLSEFFKKNKLSVKNITTQKEFLINMGIQERAEIISKKMTFGEKSNLYLRLKRLLSPKLMGDLFKVILAYKSNHKNFLGF